MSGWWSLNVIIAELPYFVAELPEAERLGNLLAVCTQLGNLAPFVYKAAYPNGHGRLTEVICLAQGVATATLVVCAFCWDTRAGGMSLVLLLCTSLAGCVGCISNVTYWAVAACHPPACTRAMSVGMTFGGAIAVALSAVQLAGQQQGAERFGPRAFFCIAASVQVLLSVTFLVQVLHASRRQAARTDSRHPSLESCRGGSVITCSSGGSFRPDLEGPSEVLTETGGTGSGDAQPASLSSIASSSQMLSQPFIAKVFLGSCFLIYGATYTVPTLQPYMVVGFSDATARQQLFLAMLVSQNLGDVLGRIATMWVGSTRAVLGIWISILVISFTAMMYLTAGRYSTASMLNFASAGWLLAAVCGAYFFSRGLLVTALYLRARILGNKSSAEQLSVNLGSVGQAGAFCANVLTFIFVNVFCVF